MKNCELTVLFKDKELESQIVFAMSQFISDLEGLNKSVGRVINIGSIDYNKGTQSDYNYGQLTLNIISCDTKIRLNIIKNISYLLNMLKKKYSIQKIRIDTRES